MDYKVTRKSKTGRINKKRVAAVATIATLGVIGICSIFHKGKDFSYDSNYPSYSAQIEDMMEVDIDEGLENTLNEVQEIRMLIDEYKNDESLLGKADLYGKLIESKGKLTSAGLKVSKEYLSREHGGSPDDWKINYDADSPISRWEASNGERTEHLYNSNIVSLLDALGDVQGYSSERLKDAEKTDKFVNSCDELVEEMGTMVATLSQKTM